MAFHWFSSVNHVVVGSSANVFLVIWYLNEALLVWRRGQTSMLSLSFGCKKEMILWCWYSRWKFTIWRNQTKHPSLNDYPVEDKTKTMSKSFQKGKRNWTQKYDPGCQIWNKVQNYFHINGKTPMNRLLNPSALVCTSDSNSRPVNRDSTGSRYSRFMNWNTRHQRNFYFSLTPVLKKDQTYGSELRKTMQINTRRRLRRKHSSKWKASTKTKKNWRRFFVTTKGRMKSSGRCVVISVIMVDQRNCGDTALAMSVFRLSGNVTWRSRLIVMGRISQRTNQSQSAGQENR